MNGPSTVTDCEGIHWTRGCNGILAMSGAFAGVVIMAMDWVLDGCNRWRRHLRWEIEDLVRHQAAYLSIGCCLRPAL